MTDREFLESLAMSLSDLARRSLAMMFPGDPESYGEQHGKAAVAMAAATLIIDHLERTSR